VNPASITLSPAFQKLAELLEADAPNLSHNDVRKALGDQLSADFPQQYCYPMDVYGDDESGDVVYSQGNSTYKAPYELGTANGKRTANIDHDSRTEVVPRTTYDEKADDDDQHSSMGEADRAKLDERFPGSKSLNRPYSERFISKDERDNADSSDFAGKGSSFPILKPGDVMAAVHAMGRAGSSNSSTATLKANIIKIAKRKGWTKQLPQAWQEGGDSKESRDIEITGDLIPLREGAVGQDGTAYLKLIAPGWGSSGYYSREVLKRDGPQVFKAGTKNFWNHPTEAEEKSRPEGDLRDLASTLTEDAKWEDSGPAGAGLYAKASVQPHFREHVDSLAKHIGMSIRASGKAKEGKVDGKSGPIIEQLTKGISVDYVTSPGAGGKVLQLFEAARTRTRVIPIQEAGEVMDNTVLQELRESNRKLTERLCRADAREMATASLRTVRIAETAKLALVDKCVERTPVKDGDLDREAFKKVIESELTFVASLMPGVRVQGLGTAPATVDPKLAEAAEKERETDFKETMNDLADIFMTSANDPKIRESRRALFAQGRNAA
jgi:hypothetical protein